MVGGRGWFPAWEHTRSPPFYFHPGRGSRTCRSPLCCPPRPPGRTAASFHTSLTEPSGGGDLDGHTVPTIGAHSFPGAFQAPADAAKEEEGAVKEDVGRALEIESTNGLEPWHLQHQLLHLGQRRLGAPRVAAQNATSLQTDLPGAPWCPTGGSEAPQLAFQISPREPNYFLQSF